MKIDIKEEWINIWYRHHGKIIGTTIGIIVALLVIALGIIKAIFISICAIIGYFLGRKVDERQDLGEILERFLPPGLR